MVERETGTKNMETNEKKESIEKNEKVNYRGWKVMPYIIGNETFEKLGAIGTLSNLLVYLTTVFNLDNITAYNIINIFNGSTNLATLIGAFLSDAYFGRYNTIAVSTVVSFLGLFAIQLTAAIKNLHPPECAKESSICKGPTAGQMAFLISGFVLLLIGAAGVRPCNMAFGADQFNPNTESGKKGINSFFNWYFFTFTFAQMVSVTVIVYIQSNVSWTLGLGIPAALMLFSAVLFFMGSKLYVKIKPSGSPVTNIVQVIVVAIKKRGLKLPSQDPVYSLFNYLPPNSVNSNLAYTYQFSNAQQHTLLVFQALQSDRRFGHSKFQIPAASYFIFNMLSTTIWLGIYDRIVVPYVRKFTRKEGGITILQRMGIGIFLSIPTLLVSAVVEERRRTLALTKPIGILPRKGAISSMSALVFIPQLVIAGVSEAFTYVGQVELYYKNFPENMRTIAGSLFFLGLAGTSYLNTFLISVVHKTTAKSATGNWVPEDLNKGKLDYFYYMLTALEVLNLGFFILCSKWYKYKETDSSSSIELNEASKQPETNAA
ncbi:unnamed protein product [Lupinus luteus]|uniref:Uncharacterized protein n=1 Tax=Lupinus luteus TaxID=3873 RepID=A0AAV1Y9Y7_LUPLU